MKLVNTIRSRAEDSLSSKQKSAITRHSTPIEPSSRSSYGVVEGDDRKSHLPNGYLNNYRHPRTQKILNWTLAIWVFSLLVWFTWTIIERKYYYAFSSKYFSGKAGSRVFMFMVVFYFMIGFLSLMGTSYNVSLPLSPMKMMRYVRIPFLNEYYSITEVLVVILYAIVQPIAILTAMYQKLDSDMENYKWWYSFGKILGMSAVYSLMLLFFPVSKRSYWLELFNLKFERAVKFHKILSGFMVLFAIMHIFSSSRGMILANQFWMCLYPNDQCMFESLKIMYGWISAAVLLPLLLTSISWVRRHCYEWFYYTHFLFIPFIIIMQLHYHSFIYYAAPGLTAYLLDKVLWWYSSRNSVSIVRLYSPVRGYTRLTLAVEPGFSCEPGQWISLKIPQISKWQYHPFSVASAPPSEQNPTISFDIKADGDWTRGLEQLASQYDPIVQSHTRVFLDGFHGSSHLKSHGYLTHPALLMIAGGIGVTPLMSALRAIFASCKQGSKSLSSQYMHVRKIVFVWVVKDEQVLDLYRDELSEIQNNFANLECCDIKIDLYVTLSNEKKTLNHTASSDYQEASPLANESDIAMIRVMQSHLDEGSKLIAPSLTAYPIMRQVMGHSHFLLLTMTAGIGFLLGMFIANLVAYGQKEWRYEYLQLLQVTLALLFTVASVGLMMSVKICRTFDDCDKLQFSVSSGYGTAKNDEEVCLPKTQEASLQFNCGCRPNFHVIFNDMSAFCEENAITSVGVGLCGPESLVHDVIGHCNQSTSSSVSFVADHEAFEW